MRKYSGRLETNFYWIIPILFGFSKSIIFDNKSNSENHVYAIHITNFFEIGINMKGKKNKKILDLENDL